ESFGQAMLIFSLTSLGFSSALNRSLSIFRSVMYRKPWFLFGCPPAAAILIVTFAIYSCVWIFSAHPYYGGQSYQAGSPLLSVRAGWFALSTTPFIFALAMKRSGVSLLTGISHEKLNIYHRCMHSNLFHILIYIGLARISLVITVVHAVPFFVRAYRQESLGMEWNANRAWWTGIASF